MHTRNLIFVDGADHFLNRGFAGVAIRDEFGNHGVIINGNCHALLETIVYAHAVTLRPYVGFQRTYVGQKIVGRVFGINTYLHGMTLYFQVFLLNSQGFTFGHVDHLLNQIYARDELRNGVLYLKAGVHFQEIKIQIGIHDELDGTGSVVAAGPRHINGRLPHCLPDFRRENGRRGFFYHFLIPPLNRTFALEKMNNVAVLVAQYLNLNVPGRGHVLLDKDRPIAKRRDGFAHGTVHLLVEIGGFFHQPHPFSAATRAGFNKNGIANFGRNNLGFVAVGNGIGRAGNHRNVVARNGGFSG